MSAGIRDIIAASSLPVLVDADNGYGDVKNVTHTIRGYEAMGVSAMFMEDQTAPKRCGHMAGKNVIHADEMAAKIRAAAGARSNPTPSSSRAPTPAPCMGSTRRCAAAKSISRPAPTACSSRRRETVEELARVGRSFQGVPQIANMVEGGGQTPVLPPDELYRLGFVMVAYPTTLMFRIARTIEQALGRPQGRQRALQRRRQRGFRRLQGHHRLPAWARIENEYKPASSDSAAA